MPDEIDEMLRSEGIFQQRKAKKEDTDEKQSEPLEDSVLDWLEEYGDRQHGYAVREIRMLRAEVADLKERLDTAWGDVSAMQGIIDRVTAENAALKVQPASNADEFASIPLRAWVIEVFQHLCHSPHTPDSWKRDLDEKTQVLLDAIEQGKEVQQ